MSNKVTKRALTVSENYRRMPREKRPPQPAIPPGFPRVTREQVEAALARSEVVVQERYGLLFTKRDLALLAEAEAAADAGQLVDLDEEAR